MNGPTDRPAERTALLQDRIEAVMKRFEDEARWEYTVLFSSEGLPLASHGKPTRYNEENLLEFAFSLIDAVRLLGDQPGVKELWIRGREGRNLVFRYFDAWGDPMILAAVVTGRKGYRKAMSDLVRHIQALGSDPAGPAR